MSADVVLPEAQTSSALQIEVTFSDATTGLAIDWTGYVVKATIEDGKSALLTKTSTTDGVTFPGSGVVQIALSETEIADIGAGTFKLNIHAQLPATSASWWLIDRYTLPIRETFR